MSFDVAPLPTRHLFRRTEFQGVAFVIAGRRNRSAGLGLLNPCFGGTLSRGYAAENGVAVERCSYFAIAARRTNGSVSIRKS